MFSSSPLIACRRLKIAFRLAVLLLFTIAGSTVALAQRPLGTDVSHYQGTGLNWNTLKNDGISFAWCKATQGLTYNDDTFLTNTVKAKAAGIPFGAYHFSNYDLHPGTNGAIDESYHFWSVIKPYVKTNGGAYMMPMLDAENISSTNGPGQHGYTKTTFSLWVNAFCNTLSNNAAAAGVQIRPVIYTGVSFGSTWMDSTVTKWIPWIANWPSNPNAQTGAPSGTSPWTTWTCWQYADTNWSGGDSDVFNGTFAQLINKLAIGGSTTNAPFFISQPSNRYADQGSTITMRAPAGNGPLAYQWRFNNVSISSATNSSLTLTNIQTTNGGNYTVIVTNSYGSITSTIAKLTVNPLWTPVFADNFDVNSSANWTLNRSSTNTRAIFAYDYSGLGIPSAPNSTNSSTKGLRMEANLSAGAAAALSYSPVGQNFNGIYRLHFDMWINANGPFPAGGTGSTEAITAGVGTAGNRVQWGGSANADGVWFMADGEGQGSTTQGDITAYVGTNLQDDASGVYLAGSDGSVRSCTSLYYVNVLPGGQTPPAAQSQSGALDPGTVGFAWRDVVITKSNSVVEWFIDGLKIATITNASITASNIFVGYWDPYNSVSSSTNLSFGLVDNVSVEVPVAAPSISVNPQPLFVGQGSNATFNVVASGAPTPTFQWRFNGTNITNATASSYTRTTVQPSDAGNYSVILTNIGGSTTSIVAALNVIIPPTITAQPTDLTVNVGANASFSVTASGTAPFSYQWRSNNVNIAGETNSICAMTNVQPAQAGSYSVIVSNAANSVTSSNAILAVTQVQASNFALNESGVFQMTINGAPGSGYTVYGSTNLTDWDVLGTFNNPSGTFQFTDTNSTNFPQRYYRIGTP